MTSPTGPGPGPTPRFTTEQVRRRRAISLRVSVAVLVVIGLLFVVVFPIRAWLDQRTSLDRSQQRLELLQRERGRLDRAAQRLTSPSEIERIARERYGMVRPGEQAWAALPGAPTTTTTLPVVP